MKKIKTQATDGLLSENHLVMTETGFKKAKELMLGEKILTEKGLLPITKIYKRNKK